MSKLTHVKGLDELQALLNTLPEKLQDNVMRGALRSGANVIKNRAKQNIHSKSGALAKAMRVTTKIDRQSSTVRSKITFKGSFFKSLATWLEYGTRPHLIGVDESERNTYTTRRRVMKIGGRFVSRVKHPGSRAFPFMRPAADGELTNAVVAIGEYIQKRLNDKHGLDTSHITVEGDE